MSTYYVDAIFKKAKQFRKSDTGTTYGVPL